MISLILCKRLSNYFSPKYNVAHHLRGVQNFVCNARQILPVLFRKCYKDIASGATVDALAQWKKVTEVFWFRSFLGKKQTALGQLMITQQFFSNKTNLRDAIMFHECLFASW